MWPEIPKMIVSLGSYFPHATIFTDISATILICLCQPGYWSRNCIFKPSLCYELDCVTPDWKGTCGLKCISEKILTSHCICFKINISSHKGIYNHAYYNCAD